ncbi:disulfide bond formation protein B [Sphingosinicella sp. CPCC 101087]|uniref:disulfide bond formation protein B n=1 Tax=Sphingosinicella sp. CPCC 101087 TaxID=2497754 RepID=UPI00101D0F93|nr:disulfide bond formation protein B [Sphingosinicella sp. CPCC 101087]
MATLASARSGRADSLALARILSLVVPAALLAGAFGFERLGGLFPCEMCWWQRWAHMAALAFALVALAASRRLAGAGRPFVRLAALAILASGLIGGYHAGVEAGLFEGLTQCTAIGTGGTAQDMLKQIMAAPMVRCDQVPWQMWGVSMAGWNAILSIGSALVILWLSLRPSPNPR